MKVARVEFENGEVQLALVNPDENAVELLGDDSVSALLAVLSGADVTKGDRVELDRVRLLAPIERPPSIRDFMIFETHVSNARARTGGEVPEAWYSAPAFYFTNPVALVGHDDEVPRPHSCRALDFELEVACVIGTEVADLTPDDPRCLEAVAGFMLFNDWSARDLQMQEMGVGLGPTKGKDFCTSAGPWIATPDELGVAESGRWSCEVSAWVNGHEVGGGNLTSAHFGWHEVVARASENTRLIPGDVLGSGTIGTGCLIELRELGQRENNPWLSDGDVVELRGGPLGVLRNVVTGSKVR